MKTNKRNFDFLKTGFKCFLENVPEADEKQKRLAMFAFYGGAAVVLESLKTVTVMTKDENSIALALCKLLEELQTFNSEHGKESML
jgi:hypothetical protein